MRIHITINKGDESEIVYLIEGDLSVQTNRNGTEARIEVQASSVGEPFITHNPTPTQQRFPDRRPVHQRLGPGPLVQRNISISPEGETTITFSTGEFSTSELF